MKVIYIYNEKLECVFEPYITTIEEFESDKTRFYSLWKDSFYYSENKLTNPKIENGMLVEKTQVDLIKEGTLKLPDGQYILNDNIVVAEIPSDMIIPIWDKNTNTWIESADENDLIEHEKNKQLKLYLKEREIASIFVAEFMLGTRGTPEDFKEVKAYMNSIAPTFNNNRTINMMVVNQPVAERPYIMDIISKEVNNV